MSTDIIKKASALAQAIADSEELANLRAAETKLQQDSEATKLLEEVQRLQQMAQMSGSSEAMQQLEKVFNKFAENKVAKEYLEASQRFSQMLETVNRLLQEAIEGPKQNGCEGCSGCSI